MIAGGNKRLQDEGVKRCRENSRVGKTREGIVRENGPAGRERKWSLCENLISYGRGKSSKSSGGIFERAVDRQRRQGISITFFCLSTKASDLLLVSLIHYHQYFDKKNFHVIKGL